jgi:hypothetical protein
MRDANPKGAKWQNVAVLSRAGYRRRTARLDMCEDGRQVECVYGMLRGLYDETSTRGNTVNVLLEWKKPAERTATKRPLEG